MRGREAITPPFIRQIPSKYAFILNPRSGNGRAGRQWARLDAEISRRLGEYTVFQTQHPGHATELTRFALHQGYDRIISAGGDGTHYEVVNGFFENLRPINPEASMALLAIGTGSDLSKTYCVPKGRRAIPFLNSEAVLPIDLGRITYTTEDGGTIIRHFNIAVHMGLGGVVGEHTNRRSKALGGFLTYLSGVITARLEYTAKEMTVECDGDTFSGTLMEAIVAKGFYDGGGMHVAPHGFLDNGLLEVYTIAEMGPIDFLINISRMYRGTQEKHHAVRYRQAKRVRITSNDRVVVSLDGELAGVLPATIEIVPRAIRIVAGPDPRIVGAVTDSV